MLEGTFVPLGNYLTPSSADISLTHASFTNCEASLKKTKNNKRIRKPTTKKPKQNSPSYSDFQPSLQ